MARKSSPAAGGESKAPLVIALVFFALATVVLGVLTYTAYGEIAKARDDVKKADDTAKAATKLLQNAQAKAAMYRVALWQGDKEDKELLQNLSKDADADVRGEWQKLTEQLRNRVGEALKAELSNFVGTPVRFDRVPDDAVFKWEWADGGKLTPPAPDKTVLDQMVSAYAAQQLAQLQAGKQIKEANDTKATASAAAAAADARDKELQKAYAEVPGKVQAGINAYVAKLEADRKKLGDTMFQQGNEFKELKKQIEDKDLEIRRLNEQMAKLGKQIDEKDARLAVKDDPFLFDRPQGKITRRPRTNGLHTNMVEIDLGSADNIRPGLTFSVQPFDTVERGLQSRTRMGRGDNGLMAPQIVPKGTVEVVNVIGPHAAECRITGETDPIRESMLPGDLLYNAAWRKGGADHVALFGVFDVNGDGADDIRQLSQDLSKMGVVVDAYYDLSRKKWVGKLTEKTIYAVEGNIPFKATAPGEAPTLMAAKADVLKGIDAARDEAQKAGIKVVRMRDFFPRVGYKVNMDVPESTINEAAARYLQGAPAEAAPKEN